MMPSTGFMLLSETLELTVELVSSILYYIFVKDFSVASCFEKFEDCPIVWV